MELGGGATAGEGVAGGLGAGADDEFNREDFTLHGSAITGAVPDVEGFAAEVHLGMADGGEGGGEVGGEEAITEADDGDLSRDVPALAGEDFTGAEGDGVAGADDGGEVDFLGEGAGHGLFAGFDIEAGEEGVAVAVGDAGVFEGAAVAGEVFGGGADGGGSGEVDDVAVAEFGEVLGGEGAAALAVHNGPSGAGVVDGIGGVVVEEDEGGAVALGGVEDGGAVLVAGEGEDEEDLDLAFEHAGDLAHFLVDEVLGGGDEEFVAAGTGFLFDAPEDVAAVGFVEGGEDNADHAAGAAAEAAGGAVGEVTEAVGFFFDAFFGGGGDVGGVAEGFGDRHDGEAEVGGDLLEGDHENGRGGRPVGSEAGFGGGDFGDEFPGGFGGHEFLAEGFFFEEAGEGADGGEVVGDHAFGGADDEDEFGALGGALEGDAGGAAADDDDEVFDVVGAGVGEGDVVAEAGGFLFFAGEEFFVEAFRIRNVRLAAGEFGQFAEGVGMAGAAEVEGDEERFEGVRNPFGHR